MKKAKTVDLILTSPPYKDDEVPYSYYDWLDNFIKLSLEVAPRMLMFNSSQRLIEICKRFNPKTVLIWNKKFGMTAFRYEPIFLFTRDKDEKIWGRGRIYKTCLSYTMTNKKHINQNPVGLYVELLKFFPTAQVILDPFMGSGTTAVACKQLDRNFIGFEIEQKWIDITNKRLSAIPEKLEKFLGKQLTPHRTDKVTQETVNDSV